jgi:CDP-diacylglycerol---glycerol-3-phosphate 3-phosphatidyltransferase
MWVQLAALTLALVALGVFAARAASSARGINARIAKHESSPFLGRFLVAYAYWLLSPVAQLAASLKLSPNVSSWACLILGITSGIAAGLGAVPLAGGLIIISALFDMLDGMLARSQGRASDAGEVLDAAVDRYAEFFFLAGLCLYYRHEPWAMVLMQAALLGSMLVSYSQAKAEAMRVEVPRGWMRRPERATYLGSGAFLSPIVTVWFEAGDPMPLHYPLLFAAMVVAVFANATAIRRFIVLYAMAKARR